MGLLSLSPSHPHLITKSQTSLETFQTVYTKKLAGFIGIGWDSAGLCQFFTNFLNYWCNERIFQLPLSHRNHCTYLPRYLSFHLSLLPNKSPKTLYTKLRFLLHNILRLFIFSPLDCRMIKISISFWVPSFLASQIFLNAESYKNTTNLMINAAATFRTLGHLISAIIVRRFPRTPTIKISTVTTAANVSSSRENLKQNVKFFL